MKKISLGIIFGMLITLVSLDVIRVITDNSKEDSFGQKLHFMTLFPGIGLTNPLTNRCHNQQSIEYYGCNKVQVAISKFIYGSINE